MQFSAESPDHEWNGRSDHRFFHNTATKNAVVDIAKARVLIIYCGAGITINRTGLSWYDLVTRLLHDEAVEESKAHDNPADFIEAARRQLDVLASALEPQHMASILSQIWLTNGRSGRGDLSRHVHKIHRHLYAKDNSWQSGVTVRNIVRLAVGFLNLGRRVVIVTTNYDDHVEQEFKAYQRQMARDYRKRGLRPPAMLRLKVGVLDERRLFDAQAARLGGHLEVLYLHGRIPQDARHKGRIVLSELDYHDTSQAAAEQLSALFAIPRSAVLVLGSSMIDRPLLTALAATTRRHSRYALLPAQDVGIVHASNADDLERLKVYVGRRGLLFGVKLLIPDFRYQIAQFCEEVLTAVGLAPQHEGYLDGEAKMRYGLRLLAWWDRWRQTEHFERPDTTHALLARTLQDIREHLAAYRDAEPLPSQPERMKLELWVRDHPATQRRLALWGSSVGTLVDRRTVRAEDLRLASGNASVRAFVEGQPQYVTKKTLADERPSNQPLRSTRWEAFLSVPILIDYSPEGEAVGLPVGVMTLATMSKQGKSGIPHQSGRRMEQLVRLLTNAGETALRA